MKKKSLIKIIFMSVICMIGLTSCIGSKDISLSFTNENITSFKGKDGTIKIKASGGSGKLKYSIDNGITWHDSNTFKSLTAGLYKVIVKDSFNNKTFEYVLLTHPESKRPEIYVGVADQRVEQMRKPDEWKFVRENADGFYINFIMLDSIYSQSDLNKFGELFTNKNAIIESDMNSTEKKEQGYVDRLHKAGFIIPYTSLNYGWELSRQENLKNYALKEGQEPRLCFVQQGPWVIGGDITKDNGAIPPPMANENYREWIKQSDGISTDGPMGFWFNNHDKMKEGSYSMVNYAHSLGKKALVMVCPYHAEVKGYTPDMFVEIASQCVKDHEDNDATPDIWSVFEYATNIKAVPEQKDGKPFNSTTGMAYYLINHIKGVPDTLNIKVGDSDVEEVNLDASANSGTKFIYKINAVNTNEWCDYAASIKANYTGLTNAWDLQFKLGNRDVTKEVFAGTFQFNKENRLNPNSTQTLELHIMRTDSKRDVEFTLDIELSPHIGVENADTVKIIAKR